MKNFRVAIRRLLIASMLILATSCTAAEHADGPSPAPEDAVQAILDYHAAWEALDFDKVAAFHTDDFEYFFFTELVGADAFPAILSDVWMEGVSEYQIDEADFRALLLPPDHAYVGLQFVDRSIFEDGGVAQTEGSMTYLLQHGATGWKVRRIHHAGPMPEGLFTPE